MSTNGAPNGHDRPEKPDLPDLADPPDFDDFLDELSEFDEFLDDLDLASEFQATAYLGYEQLVGLVLWSATENKLRIHDVSNMLNTTSLEREFSARCAPVEWEETPETELEAKFSFSWPVDFTTLSMYGDAGVEALYRGSLMGLSLEPGSAAIFVEFLIEYSLPDAFVATLNTDEGVEAVARRIRQVFSEVASHDNIVHIKAEAHFSGKSLDLTAITAFHGWTLEDELYDLAVLAGSLNAIMTEVHQVLLHFQREFSV